MSKNFFALLTVAMQIDAAIRLSGKPIKQIAAEVGVKSNVISMMKSGATRVPLERVPALADALNIERWTLMYLCLSEYHPALYAALEACFPGINLSPADVDWLPEARKLFQELLGEKRRARKMRRIRPDSLNYFVSSVPQPDVFRLATKITSKAKALEMSIASRSGSLALPEWQGQTL